MDHDLDVLLGLRPTDLNPFAKARASALELFADRGVTATSFRAVAAAAGVSTGVVQHHFPSKTAMRDEVARHVAVRLLERFTPFEKGTDPAEAAEWLQDQLGFLREDHAVALRFVARGIADQDPQALAIFDDMVARAQGYIQWFAANGQPCGAAGAPNRPTSVSDLAVTRVTRLLAGALFEPTLRRGLPRRDGARE